MFSIPSQQLYDRKAQIPLCIDADFFGISGDTEWPPLNVNRCSQTVKLLWLQGKADISIMLSQHRGLGQVWWLLCPVLNPAFVFFFFPFIWGLQV